VFRVVTILIIALLVFLVIRSSVNAFLAGLRGAARRPTSPRAMPDQLVKDPVCETYIPRRKAISRGSGAATRYFCSAACADRYAARS